MISLTNHDSSEGEQWGRYNLPSLMYPLWVNHPDIYFPLADETESLLLNHHLRVLGEWEDGQLGEDFDKVISPPIENATIGYIFNIIIYIYIHIYIYMVRKRRGNSEYLQYVCIYIYIYNTKTLGQGKKIHLPQLKWYWIGWWFFCGIPLKEI